VRTYGEYCAMAKALDVIGDRWTLLIVRELLLRGRCRYTDLRAGLPGIATNLLADRLRELEQAGVIAREAAPPPIATTLFHLTTRGEQLRPVMHELVRWGAPLMQERSDGDAFRGHWLTPPGELFLTDRTPDRPPITIEVRADDQAAVIETADGGVRIRAGSAERPDAVLTGPPQLIIAVLFGDVSLTQARAHGLRYRGNPAALARIRTHADPRRRTRRAAGAQRRDSNPRPAVRH
jgi:DNA-binding HxlR family transcriptional regulator